MLAAEKRVGGDIEGAQNIMAAPVATTRREICALSGGAAHVWCPTRRSEWTASESPLAPCTWHHLADGGIHTYLPPEYSAWQGSQQVPEGSRRFQKVLGSSASTNSSATKPTVLTIVSPADGSTYLIDPTLRREFQAIPLRVSAATGDVQWIVNGRPLGTRSAGDSLEWSLIPGRHKILARDSRGHTAEATVTVR
jgi:penicillin-binding protein 1C